MMFVIVRMADAHAHICADGKEPAASVHLGDGGVHPCETDPGAGHTGDKDVQFAKDVVAKKASVDDLGLPPAFPVVVHFLANPFGEPLAGVAAIEVVRAPFWFLPPLRGPPA